MLQGLADEALPSANKAVGGEVKVLESKLNKNDIFDTNSYSDRLLRLVQVVFAVVIGSSLIQFNSILFPPQCTIEFWALFGVYVSAITSWTGYHYRMNSYPYTPTKYGVTRLFFDMLIVIMYTYLLFEGAKQGQSLEFYLWGFSIVFFLYIVSGWLRCEEYSDKKASELKTLISFFLGYSLLVSLTFNVLVCFTSINIILLNKRV